MNRDFLFFLIFSSGFIVHSQCEYVTVESITNPGPYSVSTLVEGVDGIRNGPDYDGATIYYPVNASPPYAGIAIVPGYCGEETNIQEWGFFYASHGIVAITIGTNDPCADWPSARATALLDAIATVKEENSRVNSPLQGSIDVNRFAVSGWSMGGGGAQIAATLNNELKSVISLTPWLEPSLINSNYLNHTVPLLIISGQNDSTAPVNEHANVHYQYTPTSTPKALYEIQDGDHFVGNYPESANNYVGKIVLAWLNNFLIGDECYYPLLLENPEFASQYIHNLESLSLMEDDISNFSFYPNPVNDYLIIKSDYLDPVKYSIINNFGQKIISGKISNSTYKINLAMLETGFYYMKIKSWTYKILKK